MVDELHRGEMPEAADDAVMADLDVDAQYGEGKANQSDTAAHLVEDLDAQTYGTHSLTRRGERRCRLTTRPTGRSATGTGRGRATEGKCGSAGVRKCESAKVGALDAPR